MPRATSGAARAAKKRRTRNQTSGYFGARSKQYRTSKSAITRAGVFAYTSRRLRKRDYRALWITRITAACRMRGISYSRFMNGLKQATVGLNRKMLSELAIHDPVAFDKIVALAAK
ncbi:MAG: 50S ribosomal protein L20 [Phycisphaerales bacterium]|nr:50S ribosomal protein L20 [Phycisphaerales bacterium]